MNRIKIFLSIRRKIQDDQGEESRENSSIIDQTRSSMHFFMFSFCRSIHSFFLSSFVCNRHMSSQPFHMTSM